MTTGAKSKLPSVIINHGSMGHKDLAKLSDAIVNVLKDTYSDSYVVHRSFTGKEILIEVKSAGIKA
jgi:hypothetical protein